MKNVNMTYLNKKIMNFNFLKSVGLENIKENKLSGYARKIKKIPFNEDIMMCHFDSGEIGVSMKRTMKGIKSDYKITMKELSLKFNQTFEKEYINISLLFHMYHEIEHAKQMKTYDSHELNNIDKLNRFGDRLRKYDYDEYLISHDRCYHEYNANIKAAMRLLQDLNTKYKNVFKKETIELFNKFIVDKIIGGYCTRKYEFCDWAGFENTPISNLYDIAMTVTADDKEEYIKMMTEDNIYVVMDYENNNLAYNIEDIVYCGYLPREVRMALSDIYKGNIKTTNLFDTLSEVYVDIAKKRSEDSKEM